MVYEKKQSGDPDFDDKVPPAEHGRVVTAGDGKVIGVLTESTGPTTPDGAHLAVDDPDGDKLDTRPAPGEVAKVKAEAQTFHPEDAPTEKVSLAEVAKEQEAGPQDTPRATTETAAKRTAAAKRTTGTN